MEKHMMRRTDTQTHNKLEESGEELKNEALFKCTALMNARSASAGGATTD